MDNVVKQALYPCIIMGIISNNAQNHICSVCVAVRTRSRRRLKSNLMEHTIRVWAKPAALIIVIWPCVS
jgi:hypothetical protein